MESLRSPQFIDNFNAYDQLMICHKPDTIFQKTLSVFILKKDQIIQNKMMKIEESASNF